MSAVEAIKQEIKEVRRQLAELKKRDMALERALRALESTDPPRATTGNGKPKRKSTDKLDQDAVKDGYDQTLAWFHQHGSFEGHVYELAEQMGVKQWRVYAALRLLLEEKKLTKSPTGTHERGHRYELVGPERITNVSPGEGVSEGRLA